MQRLALLLLLLLLALVPAAAQTRIRVGVSPVQSSAGLFLAFEKGYFRQEGLAVDLVPFRSSGPEMLPLLATGQLEVGGGNLGAGFYNALARGVKLRVVADKGSNLPGHGYLALVARPGLTVRGPADLKGRTVAFTGKGVSQEIVVDRYLRGGGLGIEDVRVVTMPYEDANLAVARGAVDATVQIEPLLTEALSKGWAREVKAASQIYPYQQSAALFYSEAFAADTDRARRFMRAYLKGVRDYRRVFVTNKGVGPEVALLRKHVPVKDPALFRRMRPVGLNPDGYVNTRSMADDLAWYASHGYVKDPPALESLVDHSYARWASSKL